MKTKESSRILDSPLLHVYFDSFAHFSFLPHPLTHLLNRRRRRCCRPFPDCLFEQFILPTPVGPRSPICSRAFATPKNLFRVRSVFYGFFVAATINSQTECWTPFLFTRLNEPATNGQIFRAGFPRCSGPFHVHRRLRSPFPLILAQASGSERTKTTIWPRRRYLIRSPLGWQWVAMEPFS